MTWLRIRKPTPPSLMDAAREWQQLKHEGEALLGPSGWALLRRYGRVMSGPFSGHYISGLPAAEVRKLLKALERGEQKIPVHLMHRHQSGCYEEPSDLSFVNGHLLMHYGDRIQPAE